MVVAGDHRTVLPVAFCLAKDEDVEAMTAWLRAIKDRLPEDWKPSCFIMDASKAQTAAAK